jgi:hypothetical protein
MTNEPGSLRKNVEAMLLDVLDRCLNLTGRANGDSDMLEKIDCVVQICESTMHSAFLMRQSPVLGQRVAVDLMRLAMTAEVQAIMLCNSMILDIHSWFSTADCEATIARINSANDAFTLITGGASCA